MKAVILAGGLGTRLSEETHLKPKPMVEIGGKPILWHIMKIYSCHNVNEFIVCCGYKGYLIKEYFANYFLHTSDVTFHMAEENRLEIHRQKAESWTVTLIDTGEFTQTGGRLGRIKDYLSDTEPFCFTYGDGVANVDISRLINHHKALGRLATVTAVQPPGRFGSLNLNDDAVVSFKEKPDGDNSWISGGYFVLDPSVACGINSDEIVFENSILPRLALNNELSVFRHRGFWQPMDTLRDKNALNELWNTGSAPWKIW